MSQISDAKVYWLLVGIVFFLLLPQASNFPTLEGDALEIVAAVKTGGVIHSPGFPLYMILAQIFSLLLFFLSITKAVSILSVAAAALATSTLFWLSRRLGATRPVATVFSLLPLFSMEVWYQSLIVEVYSLAILWMLLTLQVFLIWIKTPITRNWWLLVITTVMGFTVHVYVWPMIPLIFFAVVFVVLKRKLTVPWMAVCLGAILGLSPLAQLPLQAGHSRYVNEGNINSWQRFWDHITWKLHRERLEGYEKERQSDVKKWVKVKFQQLAYFASELAHQYFLPLSMIILFLVLLIFNPFAFLFIARGPPTWVHHGLFLFCLGLFFNIWIVFAGSDFQPSVLSEMKVHFVPIYYFFSLWLALGVSLFQNRQMLNAIVGLVVVVLLVHVGINYSRHNLSNNDLAVRHGKELLSHLPENTILLSQGDIDLMSIVYQQAVKGFRADVTLVNLVNGTRWYFEHRKATVSSDIWPSFYSKYFQLEVIEKNYQHRPIYFSNFYASLLALQQPSMKGRFLVVPEKGGYKLSEEKRMLKEAVDEAIVSFSVFSANVPDDFLLREVEKDLSGQYIDYYSRRAELLSVFGKTIQAQKEWRMGAAQPLFDSKFNHLMHDQLLKVQKRFNIRD